MSATDAAYGLVPVGKLGGRVENLAVRHFKIASGYATNIFHGDLVKLVVDGTIEKDTGTTTATPVGVFLGVQYTDSTMGFLNRQYWPASTVASDAFALVCDDPDALFMVQSDATLSRNAIGGNAPIVQGSGDTSTGKSGVQLDGGSVADTATLPLRIIDFWEEDEIGTSFPHMIVKINEGDHQYRNSTGLALS